MIVLEGTDAVGKTSVINNLKEYELVDRDNNICSLIDFNISLVERCNRICDYVNKNDKKVIILVNNDKNELERRVSSRKIRDQYDKYSYLYNLVYLETYYYIYQNELSNNIYLVDCTGLNIEEQTLKVKELIDSL